jgi:hypothetical protein
MITNKTDNADHTDNDHKEEVQAPGNWLPLEVRYEGEAQITFADPGGYAKGHAVAYIKPEGKLQIDLQLTEVEAQDPDIQKYPAEVHWEYLISGNKPVKLPGGGERHYGIGAMGPTPRYARIEIATANGIFTASSAMYGGEPLLTGKPRFTTSEATFAVAGVGSAKYWVLPLTNLLTHFRTRCDALAQHPLRILPRPPLPTGNTEEDQVKTGVILFNDHRLICFDFAGEPGFIEPLLDYREREKLLKSYKVRNAITAVMVGSTGGADIDKLDDWLPTGFLSLLGLASGAEVSAAWVELRDEQGRLVRRVHKDLGYPSYVPGTVTIHELVAKDPNKSGIGYMLSKAATSAEFGNSGIGQSHIEVVVRQLISSGLSNRRLEERMTLVIRMLEGLCRYYKVQGRDLLQDLDVTQRKEVDDAINDAVGRVRALINAAKTAKQQAQLAALSTIENNLRAAKTKDEKFRRALVALLDHFKLPDAQIIDAHFLQQNRPQGLETWSQLISFYRNIPIHEGYYDKLKGHDFEEAVAVMKHLHDILVRIVFNVIGYDGEYQPTMMLPGPRAVRVNWVDPASTSAADLGY